MFFSIFPKKLLPSTSLKTVLKANIHSYLTMEIPKLEGKWVAQLNSTIVATDVTLVCILWQTLSSSPYFTSTVLSVI